jgi:hypothetical protein
MGQWARVVLLSATTRSGREVGRGSRSSGNAKTATIAYVMALCLSSLAIHHLLSVLSPTPIFQRHIEFEITHQLLQDIRCRFSNGESASS